MNFLILADIKEAHAKMSGYAALLNYRYMNLCIKAEAASLLPVTVSTELEDSNLEDLALVSIPTEYQLAVYPKLEQYLENIAKGIANAHPEFKMQMETIKNGDGKDIKYLLYTMPDVDKDRRDVLDNLTEEFYEEAKLRIEKVNTDFQLKLLEAANNNVAKEDLDEIKKEYEEGYNQQKESINQLHDDKKTQISEAYHKYITEHPEAEEVEPDEEEKSNENYKQSMKLSYDE